MHHPHMRPIAKPSRPQHYVLPKSELMDPPYSWWASPTWPYPRAPLPYESETRARGTGLIWGGGCAPRRCCYRPPQHWWGSWFPKHRCC